jgi:hypothetical protein
VIEKFVESVQNDTQPLVSGEEGKRSLAVVLAALESNEKKIIAKVATGVLA